MTVRADVLFAGYAGAAGVAGTIGLVRDGDHTIVIDPGMVPDRAVIYDALDALGVGVGDVTDVVLSHHHPDHTVNIALFPPVPVHDFWAIYHGDQWEDRPAEGARISPHVRLIETPGHSPQDITTLVDTPAGRVAFTHCWLYEGIGDDRRATDFDALIANRSRIAALADLVVPGHGPAFEI